MKIVPASLLLITAVAASVVAYRAPERDYVPLELEGGAPETHVPRAIADPIPAGFQVTDLMVDGPCCLGCTGKLYSALLEVPGVEKAAIRFDKAGTLAQALVPLGFDGGLLKGSLTFDKYSVRSQSIGRKGPETP
ncbi:MAG: copper chaperone CopZ [Planctomycetota bacterium]|jgi:copper chaperone CopZ